MANSLRALRSALLAALDQVDQSVSRQISSGKPWRLSRGHANERIYEIPMKFRPTPNATDVTLGVAPYPYPRGLSEKITDLSHGNNPFPQFTPAHSYVSWSGSTGLPRTDIDAATKRARARYGVEAMRSVANALSADARRFSPRRYHFSGATLQHDKLYESLKARMRREGYRMKRHEDGFELTRFRPTLAERVVEDLAMTAPIAAGLGYAAFGPRAK